MMGIKNQFQLLEGIRIIRFFYSLMKDIALFSEAGSRNDKKS